MAWADDMVIPLCSERRSPSDQSRCFNDISLLFFGQGSARGEADHSKQGGIGEQVLRPGRYPRMDGIVPASEGLGGAFEVGERSRLRLRRPPYGPIGPPLGGLRLRALPVPAAPGGPSPSPRASSTAPADLRLRASFRAGSVFSAA